jgi:hypothetical protein
VWPNGAPQVAFALAQEYPPGQMAKTSAATMSLSDDDPMPASLESRPRCLDGL